MTPEEETLFADQVSQVIEFLRKKQGLPVPSEQDVLDMKPLVEEVLGLDREGP